MTESTLDALPKPFINAMRTLFDVMDDKRAGYVRLMDIERRWSDNGQSRNLPPGVIESLRKVTPANGLLTFERFCAGLRIALLRHDPGKRPYKSRPASVPLPERGHAVLPPRKSGTPVGKLIYPPVTERIQLNSSRLRTHASSGLLTTATVMPFQQQRTTSMPQLKDGKQYPLPPKRESASPSSNRWFNRNDGNMIPKRLVPLPNNVEPMDRSKVCLALEKWRLMKSYPNNSILKQENQENVRPARKSLLRNSKSFPSLINDQVSSSDVDSGVGMHPHDRGPAAKKASRRREPRRHTVSNGIDYNMIKRLKLLEQEKDYLLQGLDVVERSRNWYLQQVTNVNDKLDQVRKWDISHSEYSMDAQHERLNFQITRISEVNQHLNALMESSEKGFPIHMNLAVHQRNIYNEQKTANQTIQRLKSQNLALTEEIAKKSEVITQLETEKSALIRELFHARTFPKKEPNDTTLW